MDTASAKERFKLYDINRNYRGYKQLIGLYHRFADSRDVEITLELHRFFAANLCAVLGAVVGRIDGSNTIRYDYGNEGIEAIFRRNGFLAPQDEADRTALRYQQFEPSGVKAFQRYVIDELIHGHSNDLPEMSEAVCEKIVEGLCEIFINAGMHSQTERIYTCGQFYPNVNAIEFTIVDTGIGFRQVVNRHFNSDFSAVEAIEWAIEAGNTTKQHIPGGLGLDVLKRFIGENDGIMQIISNNGFYQLNGDKADRQTFDHEFPGTIVNLQFKTEARQSYLPDNETQSTPIR